LQTDKYDFTKTISMTDLFVKVKTQQEQNLPFVIFCKPNSDKIIGLFQKNDHLYFLENFEEKGFVFAPFDANEFPFIPLEYSGLYVENVNIKKDYFVSNVISVTENTKAKKNFENLVSKGIRAIKNNQFQKVVLSRKEKISLTDFDVEVTFKRLITNYPTAFKYCFFHPKIGTWLGATPEQLLQTDGNSLKTVALAGTQLNVDNQEVIWKEKEKNEQQLVTDFIVNELEELIKEITISSPYSVRAGNLWHIKTDISATAKNKNAFKKIIKALHPTSAVCGLPKQEAKEFILEFENYDREYYSGFLGEMNIDLLTFKTQKTDLFVNLRCMKIEKKTANLFIGCGITEDSIPENEYIETVNKSMTMKKIL
jgi:isochorismate synthase